MGDYASLDDLFGGVATPEEDITLPSGRVIRIRSLTRAEVLAGGRLGGAAEIERHVLVCGMVQPTVTAEQAEQWQSAPAGSAAAKDCDAASFAIMRLSGMAGDATKSGRPDDAGPTRGSRRVRAGRASAQDGPRDPGAAEQ